MLKRLRDKIKIIPFISLTLSIVVLIIILSTINATIAGVMISSASVVIYLVDKIKPELVDTAIIKWNSFSVVVHIGLITFIIASVLYLFRLFIKGYRIKIIRIE